MTILKNIYLAGGMMSFGAIDYEKSNKWRKRLKDKLEKSSKCTVQCFNPNEHFNFCDKVDYDSEREVMDYDLYRLRHSDLVIMNFNDPKSLGTMAELAISYERKIPVIGLKEDEDSEIHPWQKNMVERFFDNEDNLVFYVSSHYLSD